MIINRKFSRKNIGNIWILDYLSGIILTYRDL